MVVRQEAGIVRSVRQSILGADGVELVHHAPPDQRIDALLRVIGFLGQVALLTEEQQVRIFEVLKRFGDVLLKALALLRGRDAEFVERRRLLMCERQHFKENQLGEFGLEDAALFVVVEVVDEFPALLKRFHERGVGLCFERGVVLLAELFLRGFVIQISKRDLDLPRDHRILRLIGLDVAFKQIAHAFALEAVDQRGVVDGGQLCQRGGHGHRDQQAQQKNVTSNTRHGNPGLVRRAVPASPAAWRN